MKNLLVLILLPSLACQEKKQNAPAAPIAENGLHCGQDPSALPILAPSLNASDELVLETFVQREDKSWQRDDSALTQQGCLQLTGKRILIRDKGRSLAQIVDAIAEPKPIFLEPVVLPPLSQECPRALFSSSNTVSLNFGDFTHVNPKFSSLQQFDIELQLSGEAVQRWSNISINDLSNLALPPEVELKSGDYKVAIKETNVLLDYFAGRNDCDLPIGDSTSHLELANGNKDIRMIGPNAVSFVEPGYEVTFSAINGRPADNVNFCVEKIEYETLQSGEVQATRCQDPGVEPNIKEAKLDFGFYKVNYQSKQGQVLSNWQSKFVAVRSECQIVGKNLFHSYRGVSYCTDALGDLTEYHRNLHEQYKTISKIGGSFSPNPFVKDDLKMSVNIVGEDLTIYGNPERLVNLIGNTSHVQGTLSIASGDDFHMESLRFSHDLRISGESLSATLPNLENAHTIQLQGLNEFSAEELRFANSLRINKGTVTDMENFSPLKFPNLVGLNHLSLRQIPIGTFPEMPLVDRLNSLEIIDTNITELRSSGLRYVGRLGLYRESFDLQSIPQQIGNHLVLNGLRNVSDLKVLQNVQTGESFGLTLSELENLESLAGLESYQHLESLTALSNPKLRDISALDSLTTVGTINFENMEIDSEIFRGLVRAEKISFQNFPQIIGFNALEELQDLEVRVLFEQSIDGFRKLKEVDNLKLMTNQLRGTGDLNLSGFDLFTQVNSDMSFDVPVLNKHYPFVSQIDTIAGKSMVRVPTNCIPVEAAPLFHGIAQGLPSSSSRMLENLYYALFDTEKAYADIPNSTFYSNRYAFITTKACVEGVDPVDPLIWSNGKDVYKEIEGRESVFATYSALMPDKTVAELSFDYEGRCDWIGIRSSIRTTFITGDVPGDFAGHRCKIMITAAKGTIHESMKTWEIFWPSTQSF